MPETRRQQFDSLLSQLRNERSSFISHWKDLSAYIRPTRSRWLTQDRNKGDRRHTKIIDNTPMIADRTLAAGMHSGLTSPSRPWVRLTVSDPDLAEFATAKRWLSLVTTRMLTLFARSNLYNVLPTIYGDTGTFATAAFGVFEDDQDVLRCYSYPIGSYMLGNDARLRTTTFAREFEMTVRQVVERFGDAEASTDKGRFRNISRSVKSLWDRGQYEEWIPIVHIIRPNDRHDPDRLESRFKRWLSVHYEAGGGGKQGGDAELGEQFLSESGYNENPIIAPRWHTAGEDVYGTGCPGMEALGDAKMLQFQQKVKTKAIDKMVDPPMVAPTSLKGYEANVLPGGITYVDDVNSNRGGFRAAHEVNFRIDAAAADITETQTRINAAYYKDLFLMMALTDRREITAREIAERQEEKMLMLGPVLERLNDELLDPLIDRTFAIMLRRGMIPPPPDELQGAPLKVEYVSIMAQAQKAVSVSNIERFVGFAGNIAGAMPSALDKVDIDQSLDEYADSLGVPPSIVRDDETVAAMRQQRQAQQQTAESAELLEQTARGAKLLSETDTNRASALTALTGGG